jgi:hypothetical protein
MRPRRYAWEALALTVGALGLGSAQAQVTFEEPNHLSISIQSVPERYANVFTQLGTPRTWPLLYDLQLRNRASVAGIDTYELVGVRDAVW